MNSVMRIRPFWYNGCWCFTEPYLGLDHEFFVGMINTMIDKALKSAGLDCVSIKNKGEKGGFFMTFSATSFAGSQLKIDFISRGPDSGATYKWELHNIEGWLCDALCKFFDRPPAEIHVKVEAL